MKKVSFYTKIHCNGESCDWKGTVKNCICYEERMIHIYICPNCGLTLVVDLSVYGKEYLITTSEASVIKS